MIEQIDNELRNWVSEVLNGVKGVEVSFELPARIDARLKDDVGNVAGGVKVASEERASGIAGATVVGVYLFELLPTNLSRALRMPPLQVTLRYLLTSWADKPEDAHQVLGTLMLAAMQHPQWEVEATPLSPAGWAALGIAPRPSFLLRALLRHERPQKRERLVRKPTVQIGPVAAVRGRVLGPGEVPLVGARVEILPLNRVTRTDSRGQFRFATVPVSPHELRVTAKGQEVTIAAADLTSSSEPLVIHLPIMEE